MNVIQKTDISLHRDNLHIRRLGIDKSRPRTLLISLNCQETCREILNIAKKLKDTDEYASIFIRKDTHPNLRYEDNRLRRRVRNEKAKPANTNVNIRYDRKQWVQMRNGIIISRFTHPLCKSVYGNWLIKMLHGIKITGVSPLIYIKPFQF